MSKKRKLPKESKKNTDSYGITSFEDVEEPTQEELDELVSRISVILSPDEKKLVEKSRM